MSTAVSNLGNKRIKEVFASFYTQNTKLPGALPFDIYPQYLHSVSVFGQILGHLSHIQGQIPQIQGDIVYTKGVLSFIANVEHCFCC